MNDYVEGNSRLIFYTDDFVETYFLIRLAISFDCGGLLYFRYKIEAEEGD